jgi:hypothetical protein
MLLTSYILILISATSQSELIPMRYAVITRRWAGEMHKGSIPFPPFDIDVGAGLAPARVILLLQFCKKETRDAFRKCLVMDRI